jgi:predicted acetyltransferase
MKEDYKLKIEVIRNPDQNMRQDALLFQFRFMGWKPSDMKEQMDRYSSIPYGLVIGKINDKMVGIINLLKREISFGGTNILVGGVGGVCVHEGFRKRGVATLMLNKAVDELKKDVCDIAFLNTEVPKVYEKAGFVKLGRNYVATGRSGKKYVEKSGMIAPVNSKEVFGKIIASDKPFDLQGLDW